MWRLYFVAADEVGTNFDSWFLNLVLGQRSVLLRMAFIVVIWAIWK